MAAIVLPLFGCSTVPVSTENAKQLPPTRIYQHQYFTRTSNEQAKVVFLRDSGYLGAGCSHDIFVNDAKIFSIRHNEQATI